MEAKELRLGNWISECIEPKIYNDIEVETYHISDIHEDEFHDYKPIPLTEEWLIKFGLETDKITWKVRTNNFRFNLFRTDRPCDYNDNVDRFQVTLYQHNQQVTIVSVEYVHQLQNLYFALTGEEPTVRK